MNRFQRCALIVTCCCGLAAGAARPAAAEEVWGLTSFGGYPLIVAFESSFPSIPLDLIYIGGLDPNEQLVAIDVRPANGVLYGIGLLGTNAQLYSIDVANQLATKVGSPFTTVNTFQGTTYGLDFNPSIDRVRFTSSIGQNVVFNPDTGETVWATNLDYGSTDVNFGAYPRVWEVAYDNNVPGAATTQQRGIDPNLDILVTVANNAGTLGTIGPLGVDVTSVGGFDVSGTTNTAFAVMTPVGSPRQQQLGLTYPVFYQINLTTGAATPVGVQPLFFLPFVGMTVAP